MKYILTVTEDQIDRAKDRVLTIALVLMIIAFFFGCGHLGVLWVENIEATPPGMW